MKFGNYQQVWLADLRRVGESDLQLYVVTVRVSNLGSQREPRIEV